MESKNLDIFYFSSTHWDREWYQDFQGFRYRLVKMINKLLALLDSDPEFQTFHFDGQTIAIEDYDRIKPENAEKLKIYISEGRILIGPWYTMPDEFNVSGESLIRNLMFGHKTAKKWGTDAWKYGYICDIFGHIAQMPQIFSGFGIKYSLLGRGTADSDPTYFKWQSPDGSETLNYRLPDMAGYGEFNAQVYGCCADETLPLEERIKKEVDAEIARSEIPIVVLMDGMDHTEAHPDTSLFLKTIAKLYPGARVHHADLREQGKLLENHADKLPVISGELVRTAEHRFGYLHLITNTLSSYCSLKLQNDECQNLLEKQTEPLAAMALLGGLKLERAFIDEAYGYMLRNHAHDSICGCAIDRVHKDMVCRYDQVESLCKALCDDYILSVRRADECDENGNYANILTVYNPLPFRLHKTASIELDFWQDFPERYSEPFGYEDINSFRIYDSDGCEIPYRVTDIKRGYIRRLYDQVTEMRDVHTVTMTVDVPPCGSAEYKIVASKQPVRYMQRMKSGADFAENEFITMKILQNGSLEITDKKTKRTYSGLCVLRDDGEIGDGWYHANPVNDRAVYSSGGGCTVEKTEDSPSRCTFTVTKTIDVPKDMVSDRFGFHRNSETVPLKITCTAALSEGSRSVDIDMTVDNTASGHRLKMLLPTGIAADKYFAGQAFYFCERKTGMDYATQNYVETDQYEKSTNGIVGVRGEDNNGLAYVSPCGIHECAVSEDGTIALTLLRSFTKTVSTNGETRCREIGKLNYKFALAPIDETVDNAALLNMRDALWYKPLTNFSKAPETAALKPPHSAVEVSGSGISTSIVKCAEERADNAIVVRVFNSSGRAADGAVKVCASIRKAERVNLNEEFLSDAAVNGNSVLFRLNAWEIATFKIYI